MNLLDKIRKMFHIHWWEYSHSPDWGETSYYKCRCGKVKVIKVQDD